MRAPISNCVKISVKLCEISYRIRKIVCDQATKRDQEMHHLIAAVNGYYFGCFIFWAYEANIFRRMRFSRLNGVQRSHQLVKAGVVSIINSSRQCNPYWL